MEIKTTKVTQTSQIIPNKSLLYHQELLRKGHLKEADEIGEDEEGGGVVDPLEEAKEDEGTAVDDEASGEYCLHPPY